MLPISFRSFTLIETLTTLTILVISVHFISPAYKLKLVLIKQVIQLYYLKIYKNSGGVQ